MWSLFSLHFGNIARVQAIAQRGIARVPPFHDDRFASSCPAARNARQLIRTSLHNLRRTVKRSLARAASGREATVLGRVRISVFSVLTNRRKSCFSCYRAICFKLSFQDQCPRLPSDIAERKFDRARERDGAVIAPAPFCLRRFGGSQNFQTWIEEQEGAFSGFLSLKAQ